MFQGRACRRELASAFGSSGDHVLLRSCASAIDVKRCRDLLAALTRALDRRLDVSLMRGAFETALRRIVPVRSVHLREIGNRWGGRAATHGPESVTLEVPGADADIAGSARGRRSIRAAVWATGTFRCWAPPRIWGRSSSRSSVRGRSWRVPVCSIRTAFAGTAPRRSSARRPSCSALRAAIERVAATDFTVLLEGESGVGKELVARQIHELSRRRNGPFVAINCAALVETLLEAELFGIEERTATGVRGRRGKFEAAEGGTLFLDEVSDLSLSAQAKLLRAIQDLAVERVGGQRPASRRHPDRRGHQPQSGVAGRAAAVSSGSLLSPERRRHPGADAARAPAGHPGARALFSRAPSGDARRCGCRRARPTR